jgi:hypothetical protein
VTREATNPSSNRRLGVGALKKPRRQLINMRRKQNADHSDASPANTGCNWNSAGKRRIPKTGGLAYDLASTESRINATEKTIL